MGFFSRTKVTAAPLPAELSQFRVWFTSYTDHLLVGRPTRGFSDLELALGFGAALRWLGQFRFAMTNNPSAARQFSDNFRTTSVIAALLSLLGASNDISFTNHLRRLRPAFSAQPEARAILGIQESPDQDSHLANAVVLATQWFVDALLNEECDEVEGFFTVLEPDEQIAMASAWIKSAVGADDIQSYLPHSTSNSLRGIGSAFDVHAWNDLCDQAIDYTVMVAYKVAKPSPEMERIIRN